jgi:hypothetical protein
LYDFQQIPTGIADVKTRAAGYRPWVRNYFNTGVAKLLRGGIDIGNLQAEMSIALGVFFFFN